MTFVKYCYDSALQYAPESADFEISGNLKTASHKSQDRFRCTCLLHITFMCCVLYQALRIRVTLNIYHNRKMQMATLHNLLKKPRLFKTRITLFYFSLPGLPLEPPPGQKCKGRNYEGGRDCCTVTEPCDIGQTKHGRSIANNCND